MDKLKKLLFILNANYLWLYAILVMTSVFFVVAGEGMINVYL